MEGKTGMLLLDGLLLLLLLLIQGGGLHVSQLAPAPSQEEALKSWIIQGNASGRIIPSCSDLCLRTDTAHLSLQVSLQPCQGLENAEFWRYNHQTLTIEWMGYGSGVMLCLDANSTSDFQVRDCDQGANQNWTWETGSMRFRNGMKSPDGSPLYMQGYHRTPSEIGSGKNSWALYLSRDADEGSAAFTILPFSNPSSVLPPLSSRQGNRTDLVINGGFEDCGMDPGSGFITLGTTQPIPLCSWLILSNEVEYSGSTLWQSVAGNRLLHLNSAALAMPAAVTQTVVAKPASNYSLTFFMSGNLDGACGNPNKTMRVDLSLSTLPPTFWWFDISNRKKGDGITVGPLWFTALGQYLNLTFTSLTSGSCGPVIDNVSIKEHSGPFPPPSNLKGDSGSAIPKYAIGLIVLCTVGVSCGAIFLVFFYRKKEGKSNDKELDMSISSHSSELVGSRLWDSQVLSEVSGTGVKKLTWKELQTATKNFTAVIGEGGFSTVYRAEFLDGTVGAVKMEKRGDRARQAFKAELSALLRIRHHNLLQLIGFCNEKEEAILVFEYMPNGSLYQRLHLANQYGYPPLLWHRRMAIAFQVANALEYLHEVARPPIVHSDVKSANVLLDQKDNAKLGDFGFSAKAGPNSSVFHSTVASVVKGSLGYLDPHFYKSGILSKKSDVYSFGVLLLELVTGLLAFDVSRAEILSSFAAPYVKDMDMLAMIVDPTLNGSYDPKELAIVREISDLCISENVNLRPTMTEVVRLLKSNMSEISAACAEIEMDGR